MALLRISYWTGAVVDALAAVQLLLPASVTVLVFHGLRAGGVGGRPAVIAAMLMLGFSALLLWADRDPYHRRGVLGITLLVVVLLAGANVWFGASGAVPWPEVLPSLAVQAVLLVLFATALGTAKDPERWSTRRRTG